MEFKLEVVVLPVSDVDRAKAFYESLGWRLDADFSTGDDFTWEHADRVTELKSALAMTHRFDRDAYTAAKTAFIAELLGQAGIVMQDRAQVAADASGAPVGVDP